MPCWDACKHIADLLFIAHEWACEAELAQLLAADIACWTLQDPDALTLRLIPLNMKLPRDIAVIHPTPRHLRCSSVGGRMPARENDIHTFPSMLTTLRPPSPHKLWQQIATQADTEGWPAAQFQAVLAENELAERDMRRNLVLEAALAKRGLLRSYRLG